MSKAEYRLSPKAIEDLRAIWDYLAPRNEKAAEALLENIHNRLTLTLDVPEAGSPRPKIGAKARILLERPYVIIYEPAAYGIYVVAIVHGRRRPKNWLKPARQ
jgi:toxin ParE1/3/4